MAETSYETLPVAVLERLSVLYTPSYSIAGYTPCDNCKNTCWVGVETERAIKKGYVPLCKECANALVAPTPENVARSGHVEDPELCPDCGRKHMSVPYDPLKGVSHN